jgi:hypothetical protein
MTTQCICKTEMTSTAKNYEPAKTCQKSEKSVWDGLRRLAATIGDYAVDVYRYSNDPEPVFSNGGTRVLIRPDRIDLV